MQSLDYHVVLTNQQVNLIVIHGTDISAQKHHPFVLAHAHESGVCFRSTHVNLQNALLLKPEQPKNVVSLLLSCDSYTTNNLQLLIYPVAHSCVNPCSCNFTCRSTLFAKKYMYKPNVLIICCHETAPSI